MNLIFKYTFSLSFFYYDIGDLIVLLTIFSNTLRLRSFVWPQVALDPT